MFSRDAASEKSLFWALLFAKIGNFICLGGENGECCSCRTGMQLQNKSLRAAVLVDPRARLLKNIFRGLKTQASYQTEHF